MGRTLRDLLDRSFAESAKQTAVRVLRPVEGSREWRYESMSYAELKQRRDELAAGFWERGLVKGKRVGILTDGGSEPLLVFLAADCIGVSAVPLCIKSPDEVLAHSVDHSGVEMLVVGEEQEIDEFLEEMHDSPLGHHIREQEEEAAEIPEDGIPGFSIR